MLNWKVKDSRKGNKQNQDESQWVFSRSIGQSEGDAVRKKHHNVFLPFDVRDSLLFYVASVEQS